MFEELVRDMKHGARQLGREPGFAAAALLSLTLGIGLDTTFFSVVNAVLLRPSAVADPDRLVEIYSGANEDFPQLTTSYPDFLDIEADADALAEVAAYGYVRGVLETEERSFLVAGEAVTRNYFELLGVRAPLGREFRGEEASIAGSMPVCVLSHDLWQRRFEGRSSIIGESVELSGTTYAVVGVVEAGFTGSMPGVPTDLWVPVTRVEGFESSGVQWSSGEQAGLSRLEARGTRWLFVKGRLAEGLSVEEARAQVETIFGRLAREYPLTNEKVTASVLRATDVRFHPSLDGYVRMASTSLLAAVGLVLLIACANVANLLLARGASRRRELAVRAAIGASRGRLVLQLLREGMVLAAAGGGLGLLAAWWAGRAISGFGTDVFPMPIHFEVSIDGRVLAFALLASLSTALICGLAPAWSSSKLELVPALKDPVGGAGRGRFRLSHLLVTGQLALSLLLLTEGALLGRGLLAARETEIGYDPDSLSWLTFDLQMNGYDTERASAFRERAMETLRDLPGVAAVSSASRLPLSPEIQVAGIRVRGSEANEDIESVVDVVFVDADYFATAGIPIVRGRSFSADDVARKRRVAIVNETMARQFWPSRSPLGQLLYQSRSPSEPFEIVGVARDHRVRSVGESPRPYLHLPAEPSRAIGLLVRTETPPEAALPLLRQTLLALEPHIVFTEDSAAVEVAATTMAPTRIAALAVGSFGALALLLATIGLYGVIAHTVSLRTREVGIRMALGATRGQLIRLLLLEGSRLTVAGIVVGTVASAAVGRLVVALLYGVSPFDPLSYAVAAGALTVVAFAANLWPALTAAGVDGLRALRSE